MTEEVFLDHIQYAIEDYLGLDSQEQEELMDYWNLVRYYIETHPNIVFNE